MIQGRTKIVHVAAAIEVEIDPSIGDEAVTDAVVDGLAERLTGAELAPGIVVGMVRAEGGASREGA